MGLIKFLEQRSKEGQKTREADAIYKREQTQAYEQGLRQGRVTGAYQQGLRQGRSQAKQSSSGGKVMDILGGLGDVSQRMERNLFPEFAGIGTFGGPPRKAHHKKKKTKGKTITIHVK